MTDERKTIEAQIQELAKAGELDEIPAAIEEGVTRYYDPPQRADGRRSITSAAVGHIFRKYVLSRRGVSDTKWLSAHGPQAWQKQIEDAIRTGTVLSTVNAMILKAETPPA